jgi:hypothetical protein
MSFLRRLAVLGVCLYYAMSSHHAEPHPSKKMFYVYFSVFTVVWFAVLPAMDFVCLFISPWYALQLPPSAAFADMLSLQESIIGNDVRADTSQYPCHRGDTGFRVAQPCP